jgi:hypothetical protein
MFQFSWPPYTKKPNNDMDVEMAYTLVQHQQDIEGHPLLDHTSLSLPVIQATDTLVRRADDRTISQDAPAVIPNQLSLLSVPSQSSQQLVHFAPKYNPVATRNLRPPGSPSRQSKSPQTPGSPSRHRRSKSPFMQKVEKVRVVTQADLQREKEFDSMKKNVRPMISDFQN